MGLIGKIVGLAVASYVVAMVIPSAVAYLSDSGNWTGVTGAALTLGSVVLPIIVIVTLVLAFLRKGGAS